MKTSESGSAAALFPSEFDKQKTLKSYEDANFRKLREESPHRKFIQNINDDRGFLKLEIIKQLIAREIINEPDSLFLEEGIDEILTVINGALILNDPKVLIYRQFNLNLNRDVYIQSLDALEILVENMDHKSLFKSFQYWLYSLEFVRAQLLLS